MVWVSPGMLETIGVFDDHPDISGVDHFGDDGQARFLSRFGQNSQSGNPQALEGIWGGSGFESSPSKHPGARGFDGQRGKDHLFFILHTARAGDDDEIESEADRSDGNNGPAAEILFERIKFGRHQGLAIAVVIAKRWKE